MMTQFSMRLPENIKEGLHKISKVSGNSQAQVATRAIVEYLEKMEKKQWKIDAIQKAKKEADKGVFISHEAMDKWLDSWGTENELPAPKADIFPNT